LHTQFVGERDDVEVDAPDETSEEASEQAEAQQ
jgi:hypothetical protein